DQRVGLRVDREAVVITGTGSSVRLGSWAPVGAGTAGFEPCWRPRVSGRDETVLTIDDDGTDLSAYAARSTSDDLRDVHPGVVPARAGIDRIRHLTGPSREPWPSAG